MNKLLKNNLHIVLPFLYGLFVITGFFVIDISAFLEGPASHPIFLGLSFIAILLVIVMVSYDRNRG